MPIERTIPGAQLIPINLTNAGFAGLNTEAQGSILDKGWATVLDNAIFDEASRPASRLGMNSLTTSAGTGTVRRVFEHYQSDGSSEVIYATDSAIYRDTTTATAIDGTLTISDGNIKFANFNDAVVAFGVGTGGIPAIRTAGNFANITVNSGTAPTGGIGTAAFGRLWCFDSDGRTLRYSALLDATRWAVADGGGIIDFSNVWPAGQDSAVAVEEFGGDMVVFGSNNTVIMTDGKGASLGIDPTAMYVSDTIPGQGAVSQFAITRAAGDLWVLTNTGIIGLQRELVQRSTPITNLSKNVQSLVKQFRGAETNPDNITMEYSPDLATVICVFPTSNKQVIFDVRQPLPDGSFRSATWTSEIQTLAYIRDSRALLGSLSSVAGEVMRYEGNDDDGTSYAFDYESGWLDLGEELNQYLKFVKRLTSFVFVEQNVVVTHKIGYDFKNDTFALQRAAGGGRPGEWGTFEWGSNGVYDINDASAVAGTDVFEWAGGVSLRTLDVPGKGNGQYIKVGLRLDTNSGSFAFQQINLYAKVGRSAT